MPYIAEIKSGSGLGIRLIRGTVVTVHEFCFTFGSPGKKAENTMHKCNLYYGLLK